MDDEYFSHGELLKRGWTAVLIKTHLDPPDRERSLPPYEYVSAWRRWQKTRGFNTKLQPDFVESLSPEAREKLGVKTAPGRTFRYYAASRVLAAEELTAVTNALVHNRLKR